MECVMVLIFNVDCIFGMNFIWFKCLVINLLVFYVEVDGLCELSILFELKII